MDVRAGAELPPFSRPSELATWNRYAAVNDEFIDIHMDDEAGRAAGYPGAFGMGNLQWAYMHNVLREWLPEGGRILELACQYRQASVRGTVTARGVIQSVEPGDGETRVRVEVWTEDGDGQRLAIGSATVGVPNN
jgi:hypothetical protein